MSLLETIRKKYDYSYPKELIAQRPARPRDNARLLVFSRDTGRMEESTFLDLPQFLPAGAVLVFNQTKVLPARFTVEKHTGGKVELLYISHTAKEVRVLANKKLTLGSIVKINASYVFTVVTVYAGEYEIIPQFSMQKFLYVLEKFGTIPLPPYLRHSPLSETERRKEYQTIFGKTVGAVAAPTASLHFTKRLLGRLKKANIDTAFVTLHVGLGTFAPLTENALKNKKLHKETYFIDAFTAKFLNKAKKEGRPIVAVGTTVVRALESASNASGKLVKFTGATDLFIDEKTKLKFVRSLITNFHVPQSSLLMLVASFVGRKKLMEIYTYVVNKKFRLFSFGDGMLVR